MTNDCFKDEDEVAGGGDEEDTGAYVAPVVRLEEVAVTTGEEDEHVLLDQKAKLYRFDKEGNQWKERGIGRVKLLKHKETGKVRLVMRQDKTLKICANHLIVPSIKLQEHAGNEKSCVWPAADFSDGELKEEVFAIRFGSVEYCKKFRAMVEEIVGSFGKSEEESDSASAIAAADMEKKLSISDIKREESKEDTFATATAVEDEDNQETRSKIEGPTSSAS